MHIADGRRMRRWHSRSMENSKWSPHNNCAIKITLNNEPSSRCQLFNTPMNYNYFVRAMERMVTLNRRSETSQEIILENYWNKTFGLTLSVDLEFTNCHWSSVLFLYENIATWRHSLGALNVDGGSVSIQTVSCLTTQDIVTWSWWTHTWVGLSQSDIDSTAVQLSSYLQIETNQSFKTTSWTYSYRHWGANTSGAGPM